MIVSATSCATPAGAMRRCAAGILIAAACSAQAFQEVDVSLGGAQVGDCYSAYDGKPWLRLNPGSQERLEAMRSVIVELGCADLSDDHDRQLEVICDGASAEKLTSLYGVEVLQSDAGAHFRGTSGIVHTFVGGEGVSTASVLDASFYDQWRGLEDRMDRVMAAVNASDGVATLEEIGTSIEGRSIKAVRLRGSGYQANGSRVVANFQLHSREWIAGMTGVYLVEKAIEKAKQEPTWLSGAEVVLIPMSNPDGFHFSTTTDRMWRKNRRDNADSRCDGVDLNRNWDPWWSGPHGNSQSPCSDVYVGTAAFSEPETQAIKAVLDEAPTNVHFDVHSYGELVLAPWSGTNSPHPLRDEIDVVGQAVQQAIKDVHGHAYSYGGNEALYPASGVCPDYGTFIGAVGFTLELRPVYSGGFAPPASEIKPTAEEVLEGFYAAVEWARTNKLSPLPPTPAPLPGDDDARHGSHVSALLLLLLAGLTGSLSWH